MFLQVFPGIDSRNVYILSGRVLLGSWTVICDRGLQLGKTRGKLKSVTLNFPFSFPGLRHNVTPASSFNLPVLYSTG